MVLVPIAVPRRIQTDFMLRHEDRIDGFEALFGLPSRRNESVLLDVTLAESIAVSMHQMQT